jgi:hypothetical protein
MSWGDSDGLGTGPIIWAANPAEFQDDPYLTTPLAAVNYTLAGYVGMSNLWIRDLAATGELLIDVATINPSAMDANAGVLAVYATYLGLAAADPLMVGVSSSFVFLSFNDLAVQMGSMTGDVVIANNSALGTALAGDTAMTMGSMAIDNMSCTLNGFVAIAAKD